jgi:hypothetical protein
MFKQAYNEKGLDNSAVWQKRFALRRGSLGDDEHTGLP